MRHLIVVLTALALLPAAPAAAQDRLATLPDATPVRAHAGTLVWAQRDADGAFGLVARLPDGRVRRLPTGPAAEPPAFDVGSDSRGRPAVVYERGGDLFTTSLVRADGERPIRNATTGHRETLPTLWRGRLAFVREVGGRPVVLTKALTAPRSRPSRRLPGVPSRGGTTEDPRVEALELRDRHLAQVVRYVGPQQTGHSQTELRLADLRGGVRQVATMPTGEGGQTYVGPSFADGRLWWAVTCQGDPSGCAWGVHRARLSDLAVQRTAEGRQLEGLAATGGGRAVVVDAVGSDEAGGGLPGLRYALERRSFSGWSRARR